MSFVFTGELNEANQIAMREVIDAEWFKLENEHPDQDFMDFIMVMIGNHNSMDNISEQLEEVGIEKDKASSLVSVMAAKLKEIQSQPGPSKKQEPASVTKDAKSMIGALGTDRSGGTTAGSGGGGGKGAAAAVKTGGTTTSSLDGGLSAGRYPSKSNNNNNNSNSKINNANSGNKRNNSDNTNKGYDNSNNSNNNNLSKNQNQQKRFKSDSNSNNKNNNAAEGPPAVGSVEYFQQMNKIAVASGFRNAQEMIASQKEMMQMQMVAQPVPFQPPQPTAPMPGGAPPIPYGAPPPQYPSAGAGVHHGYMGKGYAQYQGRGRGQPPAAGRGEYGGRGGYAGRGRAFPPPGAPPAGAGEDSADATAAGGATGYVPTGSNYRGRGSWRGAPTGGRFQATTGRGYQGRNYNPNFGGRGAGRGEGGSAGADAPSRSSNTWVREPDMDSSLSSGR